VIDPKPAWEYIGERLALREPRRARYLKRYARHSAPRQGRGRKEIIHTLFPYSQPFNIERFAEAMWGAQLRFKPVRLGR